MNRHVGRFLNIEIFLPYRRVAFLWILENPPACNEPQKLTNNGVAEELCHAVHPWLDSRREDPIWIEDDERREARAV